MVAVEDLHLLAGVDKLETHLKEVALEVVTPTVTEVIRINLMVAILVEAGVIEIKDKVREDFPIKVAFPIKEVLIINLEEEVDLLVEIRTIMVDLEEITDFILFTYCVKT